VTRSDEERFADILDLDIVDNQLAPLARRLRSLS